MSRGDMTIKGIDVSSYQGHIDWTMVKRAGIRFACAKATEGIWYHDPTFPHNWYGMKRNGILRGAYHFLHPHEDGRSQADYHHAYVRDSGHYEVGDFCMLDVEVTDGKSADVVVQCAVDFVTRALAQINKQVCLYTGPWFWQELGYPREALLEKRPLWLASYSKVEPDPLPGWPVVSFWQYSQSEYVQGVNGNVDADLFEGDMNQLKAVLKWP